MAMSMVVLAMVWRAGGRGRGRGRRWHHKRARVSQELYGYDHKPFLATCHATMKSFKWRSIINVRALCGHVILVSERLLWLRLLGKVRATNAKLEK